MCISVNTKYFEDHPDSRGLGYVQKAIKDLEVKVFEDYNRGPIQNS